MVGNYRNSGGHLWSNWAKRFTYVFYHLILHKLYELGIITSILKSRKQVHRVSDASAPRSQNSGSPGFEANFLTLKLTQDHLTILGGRYHHHHHYQHQYHLHFTHVIVEAQKGKATCSGLPSMEALARGERQPWGIRVKIKRRAQRHDESTRTRHLLGHIQPATCPL